MHSPRRILTAASTLVAAEGLEAATIGGIARQLGAPTGSIYHRFPSRDVILAHVWLDAVEAFQHDLLQILNAARTLDDGLEAALHVPRWVAAHTGAARILVLYRQEELLASDLPRALRERAGKANMAVEQALRGFASRALRRRSKREMRRLTFALVEAPLAAVRPHVRRGEKPPPVVTELVETTYRAVVASIAAARRPKE